MSSGKRLLRILKQNVNIVCVCVGDKYNKQHVNRLYRMVKRNCSLPFSFYCISDKQQDVNTIFVNKELDLESYWWKICLFNLDLHQPTFYFDLDIVIQNNFDYLIDRYDPYYCLTIKALDNGVNHPYTGRPDNILVVPESIINTSVMLFNPINMKEVYNKFFKDPDTHMVKYYGFDRFTYHNYNKFNYLQYGKDWYHRAKGGRLDHHLQGNLNYDPDSTFCILSQCTEEHYKGLEKYFL